MSSPLQPTDPTLRRLLNRRELAAARHRSALSRRLGLAESEMLAIAHLAQRGQLSPSELGALLGLSSGGVSALVARLEEAGHVEREAHPTDGRSNLVRLSPALVRRAGEAFAPLVDDLDRLSAELDEAERAVVRRYLERVAAISEDHARRARDTRAEAEPPASPVPALWG